MPRENAESDDNESEVSLERLSVVDRSLNSNTLSTMSYQQFRSVQASHTLSRTSRTASSRTCNSTIFGQSVVSANSTDLTGIAEDFICARTRKPSHSLFTVGPKVSAQPLKNG
jgi:hypothetical protein